MTPPRSRLLHKCLFEGSLESIWYTTLLLREGMHTESKQLLHSYLEALAPGSPFSLVSSWPQRLLPSVSVSAPHTVGCLVSQTNDFVCVSAHSSCSLYNTKS